MGVPPPRRSAGDLLQEGEREAQGVGVWESVGEAVEEAQGVGEAVEEGVGVLEGVEAAPPPLPPPRERVWEALTVGVRVALALERSM